ncbi:N-acetylneuraminate synthase family protein [Kordiimonas laminariae]|uniref:N-acetylneuraminate synthase family protein n=1 Tax=Kordiimonas laminariae TaxID=2917717 RepID=UPI001FF1F425|nr:N-acetylneuraminate synthase family protein [Kordiimonas laminariae]MCK0070489.1 N-acetylneuraminate synthase family protein [Kordiimonas laminariae]
MSFFISEVSSNHAQNIERAKEFIRRSAEIGCDAVKFQLFKIDELFAPEILSRSKEHQRRRNWELPLEFLPELKAECDRHDIQFSCTPFYLKAVEELKPYVDFYKIASYELPWDDLIIACACTGKPLILSTGMATLEEVLHAVNVFNTAGGAELTLLHCVSGYPAPPESCNLSAIKTIREAAGARVGWSDHSRDPGIISRAIDRYDASVIEFHIDLDENGAEYQAGHCWLPDEIAPLISAQKRLALADGDGVKTPTAAEIADRPWRADPSDGLRPTKAVRLEWQKK